MSNTTPVSSDSPSGGWSGGPPGPRGAWRTIHASGGPLQGGSATPGSGHAAGPELHAHAGTDRLGGLRDAVLPRALARAAHDHQVAVPEGKAQALAAAHRTEHQRTGRTERDDRDHRVRGPAPADAVSVPGDAVAPVPVQAHTRADESFAELRAVVAVQRLPRLGEQKVGEQLGARVPAQEAGDRHLAV